MSELKELIGRILRVDVKELDIPVYGELVEVAPYWITVKKRDGTHRMISRGRILGLEPVGRQ